MTRRAYITQEARTLRVAQRRFYDVLARRRLGRNGAHAREAEPRGRWHVDLGIEVNRSQLHDLERWLDGAGDVADTAPGRAGVARRTFRAAHQAEPEAAWAEHTGD